MRPWPMFLCSLLQRNGMLQRHGKRYWEKAIFSCVVGPERCLYNPDWITEFRDSLFHCYIYSLSSPVCFPSRESDNGHWY